MRTWMQERARVFCASRQGSRAWVTSGPPASSHCSCSCCTGLFCCGAPSAKSKPSSSSSSSWLQVQSRLSRKHLHGHEPVPRRRQKASVTPCARLVVIISTARAGQQHGGRHSWPKTAGRLTMFSRATRATTRGVDEGSCNAADGHGTRCSAQPLSARRQSLVLACWTWNVEFAEQAFASAARAANGGRLRASSNSSLHCTPNHDHNHDDDDDDYE